MAHITGMQPEGQPPPAVDRPHKPSLEEAILALAAARGPGKSICPSEPARAWGGENWRRLMGEVRAIAVRLANAGRLRILRKGKPVDPDNFKGVYRLQIVAPE